jgi:hypothetical protein
VVSLKAANFDIQWSPERARGGGQAATANSPPHHPAGIRRNRGVRAEGDHHLHLPQELSIGGIRKSEILKPVITATNKYLSDSISRRRSPTSLPAS